MQRRRQKKATIGARSKTQKPDRFTPLLVEIKISLGDHWTFYEECINGVLEAAANQQDMTAWFEQMQQLVGEVDKLQLSHEGILFLLRDMGIHAPKQQSWGEREGVYPSPPISIPEESSELASSSIENMVSHPVPSPSTMSSLLPLRPLQPSTSAIADWSPPRAPPPRTQHEQRQHQPTILRDKVLPFDFSASVQPGLTFPKDFRAYHCVPDEIIVTKNYSPPPPNPLRKTSNNAVLFSDPALRANVAELFGYTVRSKDKGRNSGSSAWQAPSALPYNPGGDDLVAWKKCSEGGGDDKQNGVKANGSVSNTWPPWDFRLDLDM